MLPYECDFVSPSPLFSFPVGPSSSQTLAERNLKLFSQTFFRVTGLYSLSAKLRAALRDLFFCSGFCCFSWRPGRPSGPRTCVRVSCSSGPINWGRLPSGRGRCVGGADRSGLDPPTAAASEEVWKQRLVLDEMKRERGKMRRAFRRMSCVCDVGIDDVTARIRRVQRYHCSNSTPIKVKVALSNFYLKWTYTKINFWASN